MYNIKVCLVFHLGDIMILVGVINTLQRQKDNINLISWKFSLLYLLYGYAETEFNIYDLKTGPPKDLLLGFE